MTPPDRPPERPSERRRPAGIERATRGPGPGPSRRPATEQPRRPDLSLAREPDLPRGVIAELRRHTKEYKDVARALTIAAAAIDDDDGEAARPYLEWAKHLAPRAPTVRESLAVALYLCEDWAGAAAEVQAYRRLTDRTDQNHILADSLRALGRPLPRIVEAVEQMDPERDGADRVAEGIIIWASALADAGDPGAGRAVLRRVLDEKAPADPPEPHDLRLWYVAGDLASRAGDHAAARRWFTRIAEIDAQAFDVEERLAALGG